MITKRLANADKDKGSLTSFSIWQGLHFRRMGHPIPWLLFTLFLMLYGGLSVRIEASIAAIDVPLPGVIHTEARGINNAGQIVGLFVDANGGHGYLKDGATFTTIDVPGARFTEAWGINDAGQIVGTFDDAIGRHGFLKDGATFTTIDVPGARFIQNMGINNAGQIVGAFDDATGRHGFLKDGATFTTIDVPGSVSTDAWGINDAGQIVGVYDDNIIGGRGFLKDGATFTTIDVPGAAHTMPLDINDAGQIVGAVDTADGFTHGFLKDGATFTTIDVPGAENTQALGINDVGQIVGIFRVAPSIRFHGFVANITDFTVSENLNATVQPPINADGSSVFNVRRGVISVKFALSLEGAATCNLPPASLVLTRTSGGVTGQINESEYITAANTGSNFRISDCLYVYNLGADSLGVGTYRIDITIEGVVVGSATFGLK